MDRELFDLQAAFARQVSGVAGIPLDEAFRSYTTFYGWLAVDNDAGAPPQRWDFRPDHPAWLRFVSSLEAGEDPVDYVNSHHDDPPAHGEQACFRYEYWPDLRWVRIHFSNNAAGTGLRRESAPARIEELRGIVTDVADRHPRAVAVRGSSWLYNIPAYRNLFPESYRNGLRPAGYLYQFAALWGQFLDRHGRVKEDLGRSFLTGISRAGTPRQLDACFPYEVLSTVGDIREFYDAFGVAVPNHRS